MKKNILRDLVKSINLIFVSIYLIIIYLIMNAYNIISFSDLLSMIIVSVLVLFMIIGIVKFIKYSKVKDKEYSLDEDYLKFFNKCYIRSNKFYLVYVISIIVSILLMVFNSNGLFFLGMFIILAVIVLFIRKRIIIKEYKHLNIKKVTSDNYKKHDVKRFIKYISIYVIVTGIITSIFCILTNAWYSWFIVVIFMSIVLILKFIINNPLNTYYDYKKKMFSVKVYNIFVICFMIMITYIAMIVGVYFLNWYINGVEKVDVKEHKIVFEDNMYKIYKGSDDFKILQLSDIHIGGSFISYNKDMKALMAIEKLVRYIKPDLIIITGDLVYPTPVQSFYLNNQIALFQLTTFFNYLSVPWTFVYGNHETESYALMNSKELYARVIEANSFTSTIPRSLLFYNYDNNIHGRSNMIFEIINEDNSINQVLYLMDSGDYYTKKLNDYDYIRDDQVEWYKNTLKDIGVNNSSMIFFHIPLIETKEAINLYLDNNSNVKYYFGEVNEDVCSSRIRSKLFDEVVNLGSTKAIFYGHDHMNNISLEYKGVRLTYGMSIDYLATPGIEEKTDYRGGTLITLKSDSSFDIEQVKLKDIEN